MRDKYTILLDRITARYNKELQQQHDAGELDFVPKDRTREEMLETIISLYALENYPDLLEPEGGKLMAIKFYNDEHEKAFNQLCEQMLNRKKESRLDEYHTAAAYLLTLDKECRKHIDDLFNFEIDGIRPEGINKAWQTGTSLKTTRLAFNLWNGCTRDDDENGSHGMPASPLYTPEEIFSCSYAGYFIEAIKLRFPDYTQEP